MQLPYLAGLFATILFAASNLPMLRKAIRSGDVSSYSLGSLVLINVGNVTYTAYVFTLPAGPIWALHAFYLFAAAIMLTLYLRATARARRDATTTHRFADVAGHMSNRGS